MTDTPQLRKCAVSRHEPRQHRRNELQRVHRTAGLASNRLRVCKEIPMDGRWQLGRNLHRLFVGNCSYPELGH